MPAESRLGSLSYDIKPLFLDGARRMGAVGHLEGVCKRFKEIELHDSRLVGLAIVRRGREPISDVHLTLSLQGGVYPDYHWTDARLVFIDCTYSKIEIDQ